MKKFLLFLVVLVLLLIGAGLLSWNSRTALAAHFLSKSLHVPVKLGALEIGKNQASITSLSIGTPKKSRTPASFTTERMNIAASLGEILGNPLIIEEIDMRNINVYIEYYNSSGSDNNWARILSPDGKQQKNSRDYLIRSLILTNLTVTITYMDGKTKTYPTIPRMEFHNISSESGFPIAEIEKAIFNLVMKDILRRYALDQLLQPLKTLPSKSIPFFN